jgi:hypothetical protein
MSPIGPGGEATAKDQSIRELVGLVLSSEMSWVDFMSKYITMDGQVQMRGLRSHPDLEGIDPVVWSDLARLALDFLDGEIGVTEGDTDTVTLSELNVAHSAIIVAADPPRNDWLGSDRHVKTLIRCDRFILDESYLAVHQYLESDYSEIWHRELAERFKHSLACEKCAGRQDTVVRAFRATGCTSLLQLFEAALAEVDIDEPTRLALMVSWLDIAGQETHGKAIEYYRLFANPEYVAKVAVLILRAGGDFTPFDFSSMSDDVARELLEELSDIEHMEHRSSWLPRVSSQDLVLIYSRAAELFKRATVPRSGWGRSVEYEVERLRGACLEALVRREDEGRDLVQHLAEGQGGLDELLGRPLLHELLDRWSVPWTQPGILGQLESPQASAIRSSADLLSVLMEALERYQQVLHGSGGGTETLWSADGLPREEMLLSVDLLKFLRVHLSGRGVVIDREVELLPAVDYGNIRGRRSDIVVQTLDDKLEALRAVIEIKGSWNREKYSGYREQLVDRYLSHPDIHAGVHLVFWFDQDSWQEGDWRRAASPNKRSTVLKRLDATRPSSMKPIDHFVVSAARHQEVAS